VLGTSLSAEWSALLVTGVATRTPFESRHVASADRLPPPDDDDEPVLADDPLHAAIVSVQTMPRPAMTSRPTGMAGRLVRHERLINVLPPISGSPVMADETIPSKGA
jgi:hypothetical protein